MEAKMPNNNSYTPHPSEINRGNCLNTAQAAHELQIATGTLQNWRSLGIGPKFIKHRRKIYYLKSEIEHYIEENFGCFGSTSEYKEREGRSL
jgi:hypothetical protein